VTKVGTNDGHESLCEFLRNNDQDARNFFDGAPAPGFERNQFGGSQGGPVQKEETFLFGNFEGLYHRLRPACVDLAPDNNARNGYLPCKLVTPAPSDCPPDGLVFVGIAPLVAAWRVPTPGAPDYGGISEAFNNPLRTIRDNFGTLRVDHVFSARTL
jgi:hypothetical protein